MYIWYDDRFTQMKRSNAHEETLRAVLGMLFTDAAPVSKCSRCETAFSFPRWLVGLVTPYISDERWAEIALRDWEIASLSQSVELRQAASSQIVHLNIK